MKGIKTHFIVLLICTFGVCYVTGIHTNCSETLFQQCATGTTECLTRPLSPTAPVDEPNYVCNCTNIEDIGYDCRTRDPGHRQGGFITCYGDLCRTGTFESERYPNLYPNEWEATYLLYVPGASRIDFEFVGEGGFGIESKDKLYVGTGLLFTDDLIRRVNVSMAVVDGIDVRFFNNVTSLFSEETYPSPFSLETDTVWLYFRSDKNLRFNGWRLQWNAIVDTTPPLIISCPMDIPATVEGGEGEEIEITWSEPYASAISTPVTFTQSHFPGQLFPVGDTNVIYRFSDRFGNEAICSFVVSVTGIDTMAPMVFECPYGISRTIELGSPDPQITWIEPIATDASGTVELLFRSYGPGNTFAPGVTAVTYIFSDLTGNRATCSFNIEIITVDTMPPTISGCPADISETIELGLPGRVISWTEPTASDISGTATFSSRSDAPGTFFAVVVLHRTITYIFGDASGNIAICKFMIWLIIVDTTQPTVIDCPTAITNSVEADLPGTTIQWEPPTFFDASDNVVVVPSHNPGTSFISGLTTVTYLFTDTTGNSALCSFCVNVIRVDTVPPVISDCPSQQTISVELGITSAQVVWFQPSATDNSGTATLQTQTHSPGDSFSLGQTTVRYIFVDPASNPGICEFIVLVQTADTTPPTISNCPTAGASTIIELGLLHGVVFWTEPTATDLAGETLLPRTGRPGDSFPLGTTPIEYVFTDPSGNEATCTFIVTVTTGREPSSSLVYLAALVIPVLLIIILLVVIIKRIRRKPATESKPVDVHDVDYVNAGVTDDPGEYIALEEQSRNTPAPKYQDLTDKAAPKAMPRQGIKKQTDYQYEDVNLGETDARKLPSVPHPDLQSEDDTEYEVPEMFEEYTGVYINTFGASKPITPTPMKITEYKTFMGRERSKVISEIVQQFRAIQTGQQRPWTAAVKLQNKSKNFFKALVPYDHSRVKLDTDGSDVGSDYINASYIKNHQGEVSFIAGQGPREGTKDDFWRMVWQEDVETIVMLVDKDGTNQPSKDTQYWPDRVKTSEEYCDITVLLMKSTAFRTHTVRKMNVLKGNERVHTVRQYEIPCWKYGGVPSEPVDLISVIKQIKNHQNGGKHLLVHCSNGVGATGTFIALYDLMDVIKTKKEVSVFDVIEGMRKDRVNMVLTKLQYLFIFDALSEAMLSPDSQISCDKLKKLDLSAIKKMSKKEFQILQETNKIQEDFASVAGSSSENSHKNRFNDILPVDKFRPVLKSPSKLFGSNDYINATFVKDISEREIIMTQSPLASTVEDFWRLVFDYNCTSIVMLNTIDDSDESVTDYWLGGQGGTATHGLMTVICKKIDKSDVFTRRQFEVSNKRSQKSLLVDHFSFHGWLRIEPDVHQFREFVKFMKTKGSGPALVHCINGVGLSAVYVAVISELERIGKEGAVDVFQTLNRLRKQCPKAVQTQDEYFLCYELLRDHLNNPEEYAVVF